MLSFPVLTAVFLAGIVGLAWYFWRRESKRHARTEPSVSPSSEDVPTERPNRRSKTFLTFFRIIRTEQEPPGGALLHSGPSEASSELPVSPPEEEPKNPSES